MRRQGRRWVANGVEVGVPVIHQLGFDDLRHALGLREHRHPDCFEFVFIEKGKAGWDIGDVHYETKSGDVFHTRPNEMHRGSYNVIEPCRFWWIALEVPAMQDGVSWLLADERESEALLAGLWTLPRVVPMGQQLSGLLWRMRHAVQKGGALAALEAKILLTDFLLQLIGRPERHAAGTSRLYGEIRQLLQRMEANPEWDPDLAELAECVKVSPSYFHKRFVEYTGLTPKSYMTRSKIAAAGRMLKETELSVTDISLSLGFATTQHFATLFRRMTGMSPTSWRKAEAAVVWAPLTEEV